MQMSTYKKNSYLLFSATLQHIRSPSKFERKRIASLSLRENNFYNIYLYFSFTYTYTKCFRFIPKFITRRKVK